MKDVEDGSVLDAGTGTKIGTLFKDFVRLLAVEIWYLFQDNIKDARCAVHDDGSFRLALNVKGLRISWCNPCAGVQRNTHRILKARYVPYSTDVHYLCRLC